MNRFFKILLILGVFLLIPYSSFAESVETWQFTTCNGEEDEPPTSCNYNHIEDVTDGFQEFSVPETGVYRISSFGAEGSYDFNDYSSGGLGGFAQGEYELNEGDTLYIAVGQQGGRHSYRWDDYNDGNGRNEFTNSRDNAGWPDAGHGVGDQVVGGGGSSSVRLGTTEIGTPENPNRLIVAGGGGASVSHPGTSQDGEGGDGGGVEAGHAGAGRDAPDWSHSYGGRGGTQNEGGLSGYNYCINQNGDCSDMSYSKGENGEFAQGGHAGPEWDHSGSGGGGGGFYGGGGASTNQHGSGWGAGGGGGSSFTGDADNSENEIGVQSGDGYVQIELMSSPNDPVIQTPIVESKSSGDDNGEASSIEIDFDVNVDDEEAEDNELEECIVTVTGEDSEATEVYSDHDPSGDSCNFTVENDDNEEWFSGEDIEIEVEVEDSYGGTDYLFRADRSFPDPFSRVWTSDHGALDDTSAFFHRGPVVTIDENIEVTGLTGSHFGGEQNVRADVGVYSYDESCGTNHLCETLAYEEFTASDEEDERRTTKSLDNPVLLKEGNQYVITMGRADGIDTLGEVSLDHDSILDEDVIADWEPEDSNYQWSDIDDQPASTLPGANDMEPTSSSLIYDMGFRYETNLTEPIYSNPQPAEVTDSSPVRTSHPELQLEVSHESGRDLDVTFYEGDPGSDILEEVNQVEAGNTASFEWENRENEETYEWSARVCETDIDHCVETETLSFEVIRPSYENPEPSEETDTSPVDTVNPSLKLDLFHEEGDDIEASFYEGSPGSALIGSEMVSSGDTAEIEWENRENEETYEWSAILEDQSGGSKQTESWTFDVDVGETEITDLYFEDSGSEHKFSAITEINVGDNEVAECSLEAEDDQFNSNNYDGDIVQDGEECHFEDIRYDDNSAWEDRHDEDDELIELDIDVEMVDEEGLTDTESSSHQFPNNPPQIDFEEDDLVEYDDRHAFNFSADVLFPDNDEEEPADQPCVVELEGDNNFYSSDDFGGDDFDVEFEHVQNDEYRCSYDKIEPSDCESGVCEGDFEFDVLETVEVSVEAIDHHGGTEEVSQEKQIPNRDPRVNSLISPSGSLVFEDEVSLEVDVYDPEEDPFNLTFFEDSVDNELHEVEDAGQGTNPEFEWDIDVGSYTWGVLLEDDYGSTQETWTFTRTLSESIRLDKNIEHRYSSIIMAENGTSTVFLTVRNKYSEELNYITEASSDSNSLEAEISNYDQEPYELDSGESRRFQIELDSTEIDEPEDVELTVTSEEQDFGATSQKEFPVHIRSSEAQQRGVPGLTSIYLVIIGLFSVLLFGLSV